YVVVIAWIPSAVVAVWAMMGFVRPSWMGPVLHAVAVACSIGFFLLACLLLGLGVYFGGQFGTIDLLWIVPVCLTVTLLVFILYATFAVSPVLLTLLMLQLVGLLRGVPFMYNLRNLVARWQTNALTAIAFTLVVALLTLMLAFVNGMYYLTSNSGNPANVFVMADGATDELFSNLGYGDIKEVALQKGVSRDDDGQPLASWELYCVVNQPILVRRCPSCGEIVRVDDLGRELKEHGVQFPARQGLAVVV